MRTFKTFEDIEGWKKARELTREVYQVSGTGAFAKDYALRDQVRRSAISIMSNIAEGYERSGTGEFSHFLSMAKGSAGELRSQLYTALDLGYINDEVFARLGAMAEETARLISGLMTYLRRTEIKGTKYK